VLMAACCFRGFGGAQNFAGVAFQS
jgi:hypothetical protein